jgi:hypothetical protein
VCVRARVCVCVSVSVSVWSGPYGTQVVLTWKKQGSNANVDVPLVRGSPVYWYFYDENAKLLERMREYEDREANLMRDWVRTIIACLVYSLNCAYEVCIHMPRLATRNET